MEIEEIMERLENLIGPKRADYDMCRVYKDGKVVAKGTYREVYDVDGTRECILDKDRFYEALKAYENERELLLNKLRDSLAEEYDVSENHKLQKMFDISVRLSEGECYVIADIFEMLVELIK